MDKAGLFFSSRRRDQDQVDELKLALNVALPNMPFTDVAKDVPYQDDWQVPASEILRTCDLLICVVGSQTHESAPIDWEIRTAHEHRKPIVIARFDPLNRLPMACTELGLEPMEWKADAIAGRVGRELVPRILFEGHDWNQGPPNREAIAGQYGVIVQSWEALVSRRQSVNALYVTASTALLAGMGLIVSFRDQAGTTAALAGVALLALLGVALNYNWRRTVEAYGVLSTAKAAVVTALEAYMPARVFDTEWAVLNTRKYRSTTKTDRQSALFLMLLFAVAAIGALAAAVLSAIQPAPAG